MNDSSENSSRIHISKLIFIISFFSLILIGLGFGGASVFAQSSPQVTLYGPIGQQKSVTKVVYAVFDSIMDSNTLNGDTFKVTAQGSTNTVAGVVYFDSLNKHLAFFPLDNFKSNTEYNVVLTSEIKNEAGISLNEDFTWSFTTGRYNSPHEDYLPNSNICKMCHSTHTALTPNLLNQEDQTTLCLTCHDGTGSEYNTYDSFISVGTDWTSHPVENTGTTSVNADLQCTACHNPHASNEDTSTVRNQVYSGPLTGVWGVGVDWTQVPTGSEPPLGAYIEKPSSEIEADICIKCHSNYPSEPEQRNEAIYFNPANSSVHSIYTLGSNRYTSPTSDNGNHVTMEAPFNQQTNEHTPLKCSDCHAPNTNAVTFETMGEYNLHGSSNKYLLKKVWDSNDLCLLCHKKTVYVDGSQDAEGSRFMGTVYNSVYAPAYDLGFPYKPDSEGVLHPKHSSLKCIDCHGSTNQIGLIHGTNANYGDPGFVSDSPTPNEKIRYFLFGPGLTGRTDSGTTSTCYTSGCH